MLFCLPQPNSDLMTKDILTPSSGDATKALAAGRASLILELEQPPRPGSVRFERAFTRLLDMYFQTRVVETGADRQKIALVAVGGYGRGEMCLGSDIDIIILCRRSIPPQAIDVAQPLFLPLWDAGYSLGHGFRTIADCVKLANKDHKVLCSLLDARFVAGDSSIYEELQQRMRDKVLARREKAFLQWLDDEHAERLATYGDGAVLLEPNLKEGVGGLRDYHRLLWLARLRGATGDVNGVMRQAGFSEDDCQLLERNVDFLHRVRNRLHALSRRKSDKLYVDIQPELAARMGYADTTGMLAVELFLGDLHRCMGDIKALAAAFRSIMGDASEHADAVCASSSGAVLVQDNVVHICPPEALIENPALILQALDEAVVRPDGATPVLSWETRQTISRLVREEPERLTELEGVWPTLVRILTSGRAFDIMEQMVGVGLLSAFMPDFGRVRDRVQFDGFHTYPVGQHTLFVLSYLESLPKEQHPVFTPRWEKLEDVTVLMLAALFHDLGKGGNDATSHSVKGAAMARAQLALWGVDEALAEEVAFLVEHHLLLARTAHRRDLSDESVVAQCAGTIATQERLDLLYLLTYADSRATGPKAWNQWSASLLSELYGKVANMLRDSTLATPLSARTICDTRKRVGELLMQPESPVSFEEGEPMLEHLPSRYALVVNPENIVRHMGLVRELGKEIKDAQRRLSEERAARGIVLLDPRPLEGRQSDVWELVVVARDQHGLFATVAGVLALHNLKVFSADAFVWRDGTVVDVFHVSAPPDPLYPREFWVKVRGSIQYALTGKLSLEYRIDQTRDQFPKPHRGRNDVSVVIDNGLSDFYTVIEITAPDRRALLYDVARTLQAMRLDILFAKIATLGTQTNDSFSVRDTYGQKLLDDDQVTEIRNALLHALQQ